MVDPTASSAPFRDATTRARFTDAVEERLVNRGVSFTFGPDRAGLAIGRYQFALHDLAQTCARIPASDWSAEIDRFISAALSAAEANPESVDEIRTQLRIRLFPEAFVAGTDLVKAPLTPELSIGLARDLPTTVEALRRDVARSLGMSSEELFDLGMANVRQHVRLEREDFPLGDGDQLVSLLGEDYFSASLALVLDEFVTPEPSYGYLAAVPNRHQILTVPIRSKSSLAAIDVLSNAAQQGFAEGPGALSPYVYWIQQRRWARIDLERSSRGIGIEGPDAFIDSVVQPLLGA